MTPPLPDQPEDAIAALLRWRLARAEAEAPPPPATLHDRHERKRPATPRPGIARRSDS
jgi:hypothetical protein